MNEDRTYKILVVEDEAVIALRLQKRLAEMGYDVPDVAYSGEDAMEKARRIKPDLILMDVMIPGNVDGIEAAKMIKTELNIPIVFLTAFSEDKIIERAKQAEPFGYLLKPFQDREIKAAIEVALYKKGMEEKLRKAHIELEQRVKERTTELENALRIINHSEKELSHRKSTLERLNRELLEVNQALSVLARNIDKEKDALEKNVSQIVNAKIMPIVKGLQKDIYCQKRMADLEVLSHYLNEIVSDSNLNYNIYPPLTEHEMRVAVMIKNMLTSQKIADMLNISLHTVKTHRKNIRRKLKIQNRKVNLVSYLKSELK
jgi:DNA-binding NarL/FixJ family response regulator